MSYVKVVATIAPFQPEIDLETDVSYIPQELIDEVEESLPCYGAVLQVSVHPRGEDRDRFPKDQYPYFIDFEPKKRELYEAVTETGEVLFGSSSTLTLGKSATTTSSTERYDLEMGGGGGGSILFGLISAQGQAQEQKGTIARSGHEVQQVHSTESGTERRELQSHTTQLSQMYNLFQAFHLGTNRALFLLEPRPHVKQIEPTFINGPRALEGIQEVFLVVVRPKDMSDFCVSALLEMAHITKKPVEETVKKTRTEEFRLQGTGVVVTTMSDSYFADEGFEFDPNKPNDFIVLQAQNYTHGDHGSLSEDNKRLDVSHEVTRDGRYFVDYILHMRSIQPQIVDYVRSMFLSARELCCCPPTRPTARPVEWVTIEIPLYRYKWPIYRGIGNREAFERNRTLAVIIRDQMLRSFSSSRRRKHGTLRYVDSDAFYTRLADLLKVSKLRDRLSTRLRDVPTLDDEERGRLYRALGDVTVEDLLTVEGAVLVRALGVDQSDVAPMRRRLLEQLGRQDTDRA